MSRSLYTQLIKLVAQRERSYAMAPTTTGWGKAEKLKAISAIKQKMNFYRDRSATVQARVICQLKQQLLTITPARGSRFQGVRAQLTSLIQECETLTQQLT